MRQRSTRYTIRAGRNLPDKEFRYLRTVIVTADIHGDLGSQLRACALTAYRNLSALVTCHTLYVVLTTWQSAVFLLNSRLTHFTATTLRWHPFFRSYGARLPSSLTRFHSRAWVYSTHPPVSVYGTGNRGNTRKFFLVPALMDPFWPKPPRPRLAADRHFQPAAHLYRNVPSELNHSRCRNIEPAFHRLRPSAST